MEDLPELVRLDSIVTVVDSSAFWHDYGRTDTIEDEEGNPIESPLAPLLVDQLEFTNIVLLNKTDRASEEEVTRLEGFVKQLNPQAQIYRTSFGKIAPQMLLNTGLYDYAAGQEAEDWDIEWAKDGSEAEEYGFSSFVYRQDAPLDREAFLALFDAWPNNILRAKGFLVFADAAPALFSLAGEDVRLEELMLEDGEDDLDFGATEVVFIGRGLERESLTALLDGCIAKRLVLK